jgi:hypothetical protein
MPPDGLRPFLGTFPRENGQKPIGGLLLALGDDMDTLTQDWGVEVSEIERCLLLVKVGWQDGRREDSEGRMIGTVRSLPVDSVLANPWNTERLERCRRKLTEGTKPPRIKVVGLRRKGHKTLYSVSDGMHRTAAARESGRRTIRAEISGWHDCEPTRFFLWQDWLWDRVGDRPGWVKGITNDISPETKAALVELGVRLVPDDEHPTEVT